MNGARPWLYAAVPATAAFFSLCLAASAAWIPLKADLAQWLIERSWRSMRADGTASPPWPWADTAPVALLSAPGLGVRLIVLEGNSGRNLAFGPVLAHRTPGSRDLVVSGHRDTHFRFLRNLLPGDRLSWIGQGVSREFVVRELEVVDSRTREMVLDPAVERLSLVTCYPFDILTPGGPLRYVVTAYPVMSASR